MGKEFIYKTNQKRCIIALILCTLVFVTANVALLLAVAIDGDYVNLGLENLRYFTFDSNIFVGICALLCIPYQIDGLRNNNYHLPRWLVNILYVSVCSVTVTLLTALVILLPDRGFYLTYVVKGNYLSHFFTPVLSIVMFIFINDDHLLKKNTLFYSLIPVVIYGLVYAYEVFVKGNWADQYSVAAMSSPALAVLMFLLAYFGVALVIRKLHNIRHQKSKEQIKEYYLHSEAITATNIIEAIKDLASQNQKLDNGSDIVVPRRIIIMLKERYHSDKSVDELCSIYLCEFLKR